MTRRTSWTLLLFRPTWSGCLEVDQWSNWMQPPSSHSLPCLAHNSEWSKDQCQIMPKRCGPNQAIDCLRCLRCFSTIEVIFEELSTLEIVLRLVWMERAQARSWHITRSCTSATTMAGRAEVMKPVLWIHWFWGHGNHLSPWILGRHLGIFHEGFTGSFRPVR